MKHLTKFHLGILCLFVSFASLQAQQNDVFITHISEKATTSANTQQNIYSNKTPSYYRHHKRMSVTYSGIALELITSDRPLKRDHPLFHQFGNVQYDQLDEGGYAYCILTDFDDIRKAYKYLRKMIIHRAPEAKVVKYHMGRRKREVQ